MAQKPFVYQEPFPMSHDTTEYYHLTSDYVRTETFDGHEMLVVEPEALRVLARQATHDNAFMLRREHNSMVAKILSDPATKYFLFLQKIRTFRLINPIS